MCRTASETSGEPEVKLFRGTEFEFLCKRSRSWILKARMCQPENWHARPHKIRKCDPVGIRIQVTRMRTWCPRPLDDGALVEHAYFTTRYLLVPSGVLKLFKLVREQYKDVSRDFEPERRTSSPVTFSGIKNY